MISSEFELYSSDAKYNPTCDIVKVGDPIYGAQFGFPYKVREEPNTKINIYLFIYLLFIINFERVLQEVVVYIHISMIFFFSFFLILIRMISYSR